MAKKKVYVYGIGDDEKLGVHAMSLVEFPAIEVDFVALSAQKTIKYAETHEERRMLYGPALIPDIHILRIDEVTQEEYYITHPRKEIEKCAHLFLKKNLHHNHTLEHLLPLQDLYVAESWLIEGGQDKATELGFDLPAGTWMIGVKVDDDEIWNEVKMGHVKGFSIEAFFKEIHTNLSKAKPDEDQEEKFLREFEELLKSA